MRSMIKGAEYPLSKVFSDDFEYYIPQYQRPYAWTTEQASELFQDLRDFLADESEESYFLGSTVLIKNENAPRAEVIDGQQRLTTLTILFAVIASQLDGDDRSACMEFIRSKGNAIKGIEAKPRLFLRERDQKFFATYIQSLNIDELLNLDSAQLENEAQANIQQNCRVLRDYVTNEFGGDREKIMSFAAFLSNRCYLVAVSTPNQSSAYRVFSVMNSRGLDLMPMDIIKANVIAAIPEDERDSYSERWEELEVQAERSGFGNVFNCIRMVYAKRRQKKSLNEEFNDYVLGAEGMTPKRMVDELLEPYTDAYLDITNVAYKASTGAGDVNERFKWLNETNNADWQPVAIKFLSEHRDQPDYVSWFFVALERLAAYLLVTSKDVNKRVARYVEILNEMDARPNHGRDGEPRIGSVMLTEDERREFLDVLDGNVYGMTSQKRNFIIKRLDSFVSDGAATYDSRILTIEHVLPQTVSPESEWDRLWPDVEQRRIWLNRIANLVPLTRRKNSRAQNFDFAKKKDKYFKGREGTSSFALTTQVLAEESWTPDVVQRRQDYLMNVFCKGWGL